MSRAKHGEAAGFRLRAWIALGALGLAAMGLVVRAVELQLVDREFLIGQGEARAVRDVSIEAHRGAILDRNGRPLAISTPVESVYANPRELNALPERWPELANVLNPKAVELVTTRSKEFVEAVEGHPKYKEYREQTDLAAHEVDPQKRRAKFERFVRTAQDVIRRENLKRLDDQKLLVQYQAIVVAEATSLRSGGSPQEK